MKISIRKRIYLIVVITVSIYSCNSNKSFNKFLKVKNSFNEEFVSHFPSEIDGNFSYNESHSNKFDNFRLTLIYNVNKDSISYLKNKYKKKSKAEYSASDSCLLIVNRFMNNDNSGYLKIKEEHYNDINRQCYSDKLPIPNFWHNKYTNDRTDCKLPPDSEIYVIDAKKGEFTEKEHLSERKDMPLDWEHGVSYGTAISESRNAIIYWTVMW